MLMGKRRSKMKAVVSGISAAAAYRGAGGTEHFRTDPLGSYTGIAIEGDPFTPPELVYLDEQGERPVQDADDL